MSNSNWREAYDDLKKQNPGAYKRAIEIASKIDNVSEAASVEEDIIHLCLDIIYAFYEDKSNETKNNRCYLRHYNPPG